mgnify:CR=1 FL=1
MLKELLDQNRVIFRESLPTWQEAIREAAGPLLADGAIEPAYVDAMIDCVNEYGPYIVIAPNLAIPHARSDKGVNRTAIAMMKVEQPVHFGDTPDLDARLFFVLASVGKDAHVPMLQSLVMALSEETILDDLMNARSLEDVAAIAARTDAASPSALV